MNIGVHVSVSFLFSSVCMSSSGIAGLYSSSISRFLRKQQLELDMEQQTGCKKEKAYVKAVYCHPAYLTYMQNTSWEMLGWKKHKLE